MRLAALTSRIPPSGSAAYVAAVTPHACCAVSGSIRRCWIREETRGRRHYATAWIHDDCGLWHGVSATRRRRASRGQANAAHTCDRSTGAHTCMQLQHRCAHMHAIAAQVRTRSGHRGQAAPQRAAAAAAGAGCRRLPAPPWLQMHAADAGQHAARHDTVAEKSTTRCMRVQRAVVTRAWRSRQGSVSVLTACSAAAGAGVGVGVPGVCRSRCDCSAARSRR